MACAFALASCSSTSVSNRTLVKVPGCIKRCAHTAASEETEGKTHPLTILGVGEGELVLSFTGSSRCHVCTLLRHWEDWFPGCTCSVHRLWKQKLFLSCSHQAGLCVTVVYAPSSCCIAAETQPQVVFHEWCVPSGELWLGKAEHLGKTEELARLWCVEGPWLLGVGGRKS